MERFGLYGVDASQKAADGRESLLVRRHSTAKYFAEPLGFQISAHFASLKLNLGETCYQS
jgi:hypothetical protein